MVQYSTALSHIFLAGTGLYCLKALNLYGLPLARVSFGLIAFHSLLGIWRWGNPTYGYKVEKLYRLTSKLQDLLVLPIVVTTIWLKYNYSLNIAYAHTIIALIPLLIYLYDNRKNRPIDAFLGGNLLSLILISYWKDNLYGVTTSLSYVLSYFVIKRDTIPVDMPTQDLFNYSMCFFTLFASKSILEPIY